MAGYDKPIIQTSNPNKMESAGIVRQRVMYYGNVISIDDKTDGGRIKVRIDGLDNQIPNEKLPWAYPELPKFFHAIPKVGEMVRISLEDINFPQRSRYWMGAIISQPQKIEYDNIYTALSTTNVGLTPAEKAPSKIPDAEGVFPRKDDVAIVGRVNTDVILRLNEVHIRAGKHENGDVLKLNTRNPAHLSMIYEPLSGDTNYYSNSVLLSDKIALISHSGEPKFKAARLTNEDRQRIFNEGHPIARGDVLVEALNVIRTALIGHIHGYSGVAPDKNEIIRKLEELELELIMQKNIVTN
jgi:hypothetical protein